jgi:FG-GAP-like repeat
MRLRILVLSTLVLTAGVMIGLAGPPVLVPAEGSPITVRGANNVAIGDVNNDSRSDLIVASQQSRSVTIFLGQGDGRFVSASSRAFDATEIPHEVALGDVNGDRNLDLLLANHDSYNVVLLLGTGRGTFEAAPSSPIVMKSGPQPHTHGLAVADFNGDGRADLVTVNSDNDNDVAVVLGNGRGGFTPAPGSPFAVGRSPYPLAIGDLDADGSMDIVATSTGLGPRGAAPYNDGLTALWGDGRGGFRRSQIPVKTGRTWFVAIGDVNQDRKPDLVTTHTEDRRLSVLLGDGRGRFVEMAGSPFDLGNNAWHMSVVDLNRDGHADVVAAADTGVRVMLGNGRGGFVQGPGSPFATGKGTWRLAVGDVNADGKADVATSNLESDNVSVLLGR